MLTQFTYGAQKKSCFRFLSMKSNKLHALPLEAGPTPKEGNSAKKNWEEPAVILLSFNATDGGTRENKNESTTGAAGSTSPALLS